MDQSERPQQQQSTKRQQRQILSEEEYTSTLSSIITREYYPSLSSLRRDVAILEKRKEGDVRGAVMLRRAHREICENEEELALKECLEEEEALENGGLRKLPRPLHRESIMGFHARVTSEDNEDFEQVMKQEVQEKKERMDIIYNSTGSDANNVKQKLLTYHETDTTDNSDIPHQSKILPIAPSEVNSNHELVDTKSTLDSQIMPPPLALIPKQSKPSFSDNQISTLAATSSTSITTSNTNPNTRLDLVEYTPKKTSLPNHKEKEVICSNTRFNYQQESRLIPLHSNPTSNPTSTSTPHDLINYQSDSTTDLDAPPNPIHIERQSRAAKVNQERETYVSMTPLIVPQSGGGGGADSPSRDDGSPIVTWGQVATPLITQSENLDDILTMGSESDTGSDGRPTFALPETDSREQTARVAESMVVQELRKVKGKSSRKRKQDHTPARHGDVKQQDKMKRKLSSSVRSNSTLLDRTQCLTPAARSLMERKSKSQSSRLNSTPLFSSNVSARSSSSLGSVLRSSYTPKRGSRL